MPLFVRQQHTRRTKGCRIFFVVGALFLIVACDQAWQDEHNNVKILIGEKTSLWQERDFWKDQNYQKDASLRSRDDLLGKNYGVLAQTQSSLATLGNRLLDVAKVGPPKIDMMLWKVAGTYIYGDLGKVQLRVIVFTSNRAISPVAGTVACDAPFRVMEDTILTHGVALKSSSSQPTATSLHVDFVTPPLSPEHPLIVTVITPEGGKDIQSCGFKLD